MKMKNVNEKKILEGESPTFKELCQNKGFFFLVRYILIPYFNSINFVNQNSRKIRY